MIIIRNLTKIFANTNAVQIDKLEIIPEELIGLVGNNGAGKTTFFRLLLDLIKAGSGQVLIKGYDVSKNELWKQYTAAYLDESFLISYLTPLEYLNFIGKLHNFSAEYVSMFISEYDYFFEGALCKDKYIRDLSKGNQCKVGIAGCILQKPELLILDEPFANLDPRSQSRLKIILKELNEEKGMTIIISSHDLNHITKLCKRVLLMDNGLIIKDIYTNSQTMQELEDHFCI